MPNYRRRHKKLQPKYVARRVLFILLLLLLLALLVWGLVALLRPQQPEESSSQSVSAVPLPQSSSPQGESQSESESIPAPEPSSQPEEPGSQSVPTQEKPAAGAWNLILINPTHAIEKELDIDLAKVSGYQFDSRITQNIQELLTAAKADGISLSIISGYRTLERSRTLYNAKVAQYKAAGYDDAAAKKEAARWVAPPGTSEHHSGLAMDIVSADYYSKYSDLVEAFAQDKEAIWLRENCARFGFVLRFPKEKEEITGINFEPWHFRYVGKEAAGEIMEKGLCLEEYLGAA